MTSRRTFAALLLATTGLAGAPALAQAPASAPATGDDEIIVTAQKREENLQNVPISIQALSGAKLEEHQVAGFDDFAKLLPSVSFLAYGPGQTQIYFRGVSAGDGVLRTGSQPTSSLYIDELPATTIAGAVDFHVYDVARIEGLSGPQGTLFGASSLSGTLRIITNKPDPSHFYGGAEIGGTKFDSGGYGGSFDGFVNIPLSPTVAFRASAFYRKDGGYIDNVPGTRVYQLGDDDPTTSVTSTNARYVKNDFNDVETYGGRAALGIELDNNWTVTPAIIYQHQQANGTFLVDPRLPDLQVQDYTPDLNIDRWYQASLTIQGKLGNWDVTYAGGYFDRHNDQQQDYSEYSVAYDSIPGYNNYPTATGGFLDPTQAFRAQDQYTKQTHELRIASPSSGRFRIIAGLFYERQTDRAVLDYIVPGLASIPDTPAVPLVGDDIFATRAYRVDRDYAAFGEASFDILPTVTVTGGIRGYIYNNTIVGFSGFQSSAATSNCPIGITSVGLCNNFDKKKVGAGETHRINLTWRVTPDYLLYATYSTGFRPGGNNRKPGVNPYVADTLANYEIGFKTSWLNRKLRINGAVFIEEWKNLQYPLAPAGSVGVTYVYNAGNARIKGIEGDFSWQIGGLTLSGSGTYVDGKLTTDFCAVDPASLNIDCSLLPLGAPSGTRLPVQPQFKGNATARYTFSGASFAPYIQGTILHQSGTRSYLTTREYDILGPTSAFTTADFAVGATFGMFNVEAYIQNAFDERGVLSKNTVCVPSICGAGVRNYVVKPRLFGVKLGTKF